MNNDMIILYHDEDPFIGGNRIKHNTELDSVMLTSAYNKQLLNHDGFIYIMNDMWVWVSTTRCSGERVNFGNVLLSKNGYDISFVHTSLSQDGRYNDGQIVHKMVELFIEIVDGEGVTGNG